MEIDSNGAFLRVNNAEVAACVILMNAAEIDVFDEKFDENEGSFCQDWVTLSTQKISRRFQKGPFRTIITSACEKKILYLLHESGKNFICYVIEEQ